MAAKSFCCSIETEPKTLNEGQINHAREVAVDIFQSKETDEASSIFIEGLKPVLGTKEMVESIRNGDLVSKIVDQCKDNNNNKTNTNGNCCQCSLASSIIDSPDEFNPKEPLSAPF